MPILFLLASLVAGDPDFEILIERLSAAVEREMETHGIPAVSFALVLEGETVWTGGFGEARDGVPATGETVYRVASISKLLNAVAVLQAVEAGELSLDQPLGRALGAYGIRAHPDLEGTTLRHLLSHTSGVLREPPVGNYFDDTSPSIQATVESFAERPLVDSFIGDTKYSNAGPTLAGHLLERVYGQPYADLLQERVLGPLGMTSSSFTPRPDLTQRLAQGTMWTLDGRTFEAPVFEMGIQPAAGLYSTAADLARFLELLCAGGIGPDGARVLSPDLLDAAFTPQYTESESGFGLGFYVNSLLGYRRVRHSGVMYGYATRVQALPEQGIGAVNIATLDAVNPVVDKLNEYALQLLLAYQAGEEPPAYRTSQPVSPARARQLSARYQADDGRSVRLIEQSGALLFDDGEIRTPVERDGLYELVTNGRLGVGRTLRLVNDGQGGPQDLIIDGTRFARQYDRVPEPAPEHFNELIGEYGPDHNVLHVLEEDGQLTVLIEWFFRYPLTPIEEDRYAFPGRGLYAGEEVIFLRDETGAITGVEAANVVWPRRAVGPDDGATFKIDPIRPVEELREEALRATPPAENGPFRPAALVDVTQQPAVIDGDTLALEPGIKLDVRYATTNNFMGAAFYDKPRALLQKPAAEALARVHFNLRALGYGLLVHDAYRPWHVTKMFWDATPQDLKLFVANPARGSRHNRGAAVDLTLYDLTTGEPIAMPSGFDEFSPRAYAAYPGGTSAQRWHRALLRRVMELEGFRVLNAEWWHFDYKDWREYGLGNVGF